MTTTEEMEDGRIEADPTAEDFIVPEGYRAAAYRVEWTPPGKVRSTRTLEVDRLGPGEDRLATQAAKVSAMEMIATGGPLGMLGIWWFGGRQEGKKETYRELAPLFSMKFIRSGKYQITLLLDPIEDDEEMFEEEAEGDHVDPT